jgi:type I restriction enzyme, S subunit
MRSKIRLKYAAQIEMGQSPPSSEYTTEDNGIPFLQGTAEFGSKYPNPQIYSTDPPKVSSDGDILFSVRAPVGELNISNRVYGIGRGLCAIQAKSFHPGYLWWGLHHSRKQLISLETGATYGAVSVEDVSNMLVETTSLTHQQMIADYLDQQTEHNELLISKKEQLISLLKEKRESLVTRAVTKGLNEKVKMKASGVEWIGEVPSHWTIERTRWLFNERNERSVTGDEELLTVSHITGITPRSEKDVNMFEAETTEGYKISKVGDLIINTLWAWMGAMGVSNYDGIVSPAYHVYTPNKVLLPEYVNSIVRIPVFAKEVTRYSKGVWSSRLRLYPEGFYEVHFPVPPIDEQVAILKFIKK